MILSLHSHDHILQEAMAEQQRMESRYANDIEIAKCQRDFELKKALYDQEVNTKKAESDMAYSLQVTLSRLLRLRHVYLDRRSIYINKYNTTIVMLRRLPLRHLSSLSWEPPYSTNKT